MSRSRPSIVVVAIAVTVAIVGLNLWAFGRLSAAATRSHNATVGAIEAVKLSSAVHAMRDAPRAAAQREAAAADVSRLVEEAAHDAGVPPRALLRVAPQSPRRVGDGPYVEHVTRVVVRGAALPALAQMLASLAAGDDSFRIRGLRLSAPPEAASPEPPVPGEEVAGRSAGWNAEIDLSQFVYSPSARSATASPR